MIKTGFSTFYKNRHLLGRAKDIKSTAKPLEESLSNIRKRLAERQGKQGTQLSLKLKGKAP